MPALMGSALKITCASTRPHENQVNPHQPPPSIIQGTDRGVRPVLDYSANLAALSHLPDATSSLLAFSHYIRHTNNVAAERADYDADDEDEEWLQQLNSKAAGSRQPLSLDHFEQLVELFEVLDLQRRQEDIRNGTYFRSVAGGSNPSCSTDLLTWYQASRSVRNHDLRTARAVYDYWRLKRANSSGPLLSRLWFETPWKAIAFPGSSATDDQVASPQVPFTGHASAAVLPQQLTVLQRLSHTEAHDLMEEVREDLEQLRTMADQLRKREKLKRQLVQLWAEYMPLQAAMEVEKELAAEAAAAAAAAAALLSAQEEEEEEGAAQTLPPPVLVGAVKGRTQKGPAATSSSKAGNRKGLKKDIGKGGAACNSSAGKGKAGRSKGAANAHGAPSSKGGGKRRAEQAAGQVPSKRQKSATGQPKPGQVAETSGKNKRNESAARSAAADPKAARATADKSAGANNPATTSKGSIKSAAALPAGSQPSESGKGAGKGQKRSSSAQHAAGTAATSTTVRIATSRKLQKAGVQAAIAAVHPARQCKAQVFEQLGVGLQQKVAEQQGKTDRPVKGSRGPSPAQQGEPVLVGKKRRRQAAALLVNKSGGCKHKAQQPAAVPARKRQRQSDMVQLKQGSVESQAGLHAPQRRLMQAACTATAGSQVSKPTRSQRQQAAADRLAAGAAAVTGAAPAVVVTITTVTKVAASGKVTVAGCTAADTALPGSGVLLSHPAALDELCPASASTARAMTNCTKASIASRHRNAVIAQFSKPNTATTEQANLAKQTHAGEQPAGATRSAFAIAHNSSSGDGKSASSMVGAKRSASSLLVGIPLAKQRKPTDQPIAQCAVRQTVQKMAKVTTNQTAKPSSQLQAKHKAKHVTKHAAKFAAKHTGRRSEKQAVKHAAVRQKRASAK